MRWIPLAAWLAAVVIAVVVLGFCAYELSWKARRLRADLAELQVVAGQAQALQDDLAAATQRAARAAGGG